MLFADWLKQYFLGCTSKWVHLAWASGGSIRGFNVVQPETRFHFQSANQIARISEHSSMYLLLHVNKHGRRTDVYSQLQFQAEKKTVAKISSIKWTVFKILPPIQYHLWLYQSSQIMEILPSITISKIKNTTKGQ